MLQSAARAVWRRIRIVRANVLEHASRLVVLRAGGVARRERVEDLRCQRTMPIEPRDRVGRRVTVREDVGEVVAGRLGKSVRASRHQRDQGLDRARARSHRAPRAEIREDFAIVGAPAAAAHLAERRPGIAGVIERAREREVRFGVQATTGPRRVQLDRELEPDGRRRLEVGSSGGVAERPVEMKHVSRGELVERLRLSRGRCRSRRLGECDSTTSETQEQKGARHAHDDTSGAVLRLQRST